MSPRASGAELGVFLVKGGVKFWWAAFVCVYLPVFEDFTSLRLLLNMFPCCHCDKCISMVLDFSALSNYRSPIIWGEELLSWREHTFLKEAFLRVVPLIDFSLIACCSADCSILQLPTAWYGFFHRAYWKRLYYCLYKKWSINSKTGSQLQSSCTLSLQWSTWTWENAWGWRVGWVWRSS